MKEQTLDIHEAPLTNEESYIRNLYLGLLQEESAEVIQAISKINRFGIDSYNPHDESKKTNRDSLIQELGDVVAMIELIITVPSLKLTAEEIEIAKQKKLTKLAYWTNKKLTST